MQLDLTGIAASLGSACASGSTRPSPTLTAMRVPHDRLRSSVRFSLGSATTESEIEDAVARIIQVVQAFSSAKPRIRCVKFPILVIQSLVLVHRELEFVPVGVIEERGVTSCRQPIGASCRDGLSRSCQSRSISPVFQAEEERGRAIAPGPLSSLGPWDGTRGAPQQSPILRPGRLSFSWTYFRHATTRGARRAVTRRSRASSSLRSRSAKMTSASPASLSAGVT